MFKILRNPSQSQSKAKGLVSTINLILSLLSTLLYSVYYSTTLLLLYYSTTIFYTLSLSLYSTQVSSLFSQSLDSSQNLNLSPVKVKQRHKAETKIKTKTKPNPNLQFWGNTPCLKGAIFVSSLYLCQFKSDLYETLNLSSCATTK